MNFADVMARLGLYADAPPLPSVVGYEVSGLVTEIASNVTDFAIGDRVFAGTRFGGYAEEVCVRQQDAVHLPATLSFEQGAAIQVNCDRGTLEPWITPLRALMDDGTVAPVVSDVVPFERAAEAHQILTERRNIGKVVLVP
ncbi:hypothetical protein BJI47_12165 [Rhodococcus sp. 1168]|nr:hypothetical protein BJI47_12165 [Rhodococcus sp. 1168]